MKKKHDEPAEPTGLTKWDLERLDQVVTDGRHDNLLAAGIAAATRGGHTGFRVNPCPNLDEYDGVESDRED